MCGIVTAVATNDIVSFLLEGLHKLEYRGYDSAGLAVLSSGTLFRLRSTNRVAELTATTNQQGLSANIGIAHTRWATHGAPNEHNAHPHISDGIAVVHNGIIENFSTLRSSLEAKGYIFTSDTDTEVIAHLIHNKLTLECDLLKAVRLATLELTGTYAIAVISKTDPSRVIVARNGSPLLLGLGADGLYAASDPAALLHVTRKIVYLEDGDIAELHHNSYRILRSDGTAIERKVHHSSLPANATELGQFRHYMQKEIFEQPQALRNTLESISGGATLSPHIFGPNAKDVLNHIKSVLILACGTSYHAGLVARYWIESLAQIPCSVELANEYRYRQSLPNPNTLVIVISQSGETADTLSALKHAKSLGMTRTLAICNVAESALVREVALRFITRAGPEIGVASTKAFTTQLVGLALLTLILAKQNHHLPPAKKTQYLDALRQLPTSVQKILTLEPEIKKWAQELSSKQNAIFLGRGSHWPIAMEGALKLKETSYIHAEAYATGELKHGPLALIDSEMPVIAIAPADELIEKTKSNLNEIHARGGKLYIFTDVDSKITESEGICVLQMPEHNKLFSPILYAIPLQLLAYHTALAKGTDVDKPRNLAKSVTVE